MSEESKESPLTKRQNVARQIANCLNDHPAISAILVGGSVALGHVDERSDIDLIIICRENIINLQERQERLNSLGHNWQWNVPVGNPVFGEWQDKDGQVNNVLVTLCYHTISSLAEVVDEVINRGVITTQRVPFRPYTLIGLLQRCWLLCDKDGIIARWRQQSQHYPLALKRTILQEYILLLQEATDELVATAERKLGAIGILFHLNHAVDALISILYALNEIYDPAERRAQLVILPTLQQVPVRFSERLKKIVEGPFDPDGAIQQAQAFRQLASETLALAKHIENNL